MNTSIRQLDVELDVSYKTVSVPQLRNFLVNALTGAFGVSLGQNADLDLEDIYEVLVGGEWSAKELTP